MKITVFTSNQPRHLSLIRSLAAVSDSCYAVIEGNTVFPGKIADFFKKSDVMQDYFAHVMAAEKSIFGEIGFLGDNVQSLYLKSGDLNFVERAVLEPALDSDIYVVFGASYIKGWLVDDLVQSRAINIHMGVSPYYRGSSCNFWALYDNNPHLVGSTIHMLSKGLDSGGMLFHALPEPDNHSPFEYTMRAVKAAQSSLVQKIEDRSILDMAPIEQNKDLEVRYTRNRDFNDEIAKEFLNRKLSMIDLRDMRRQKINNDLFYNPVYA